MGGLISFLHVEPHTSNPDCAASCGHGQRAGGRSVDEVPEGDPDDRSL